MYAFGSDSIAIGRGSIAHGEGSVSIGVNAVAFGPHDMTFGQTTDSTENFLNNIESFCTARQFMRKWGVPEDICFMVFDYFQQKTPTFCVSAGALRLEVCPQFPSDEYARRSCLRENCVYTLVDCPLLRVLRRK